MRKGKKIAEAHCKRGKRGRQGDPGANGLSITGATGATGIQGPTGPSGGSAATSGTSGTWDLVIGNITGFGLARTHINNYYIQIGNIVKASVTVTLIPVDPPPTATYPTLFSFNFTLPILPTSPFTDPGQMIGTGTIVNNAQSPYLSAAISADGTVGLFTAEGVDGSGSCVCSCDFTYSITS